MKKLHYIFVFIGLALTFFYGCDNEEIIDLQTNYIVIDTLSNSYEFKENLNLSIDDTFGESIYIDLNNDNYNDIKIWNELDYSSGGINLKQSGIKILDSSVYIASIEMIDTTCTYEKIGVTGPNDTTYYHETYGNSDYYDGTPELQVRINNYPRVFNDGDTLTNSNYFIHSNLLLTYDNQTNSLWSGNGGCAYDIQYGIWNNTANKFIGLKMIIDEKTYIGWLKITVSDYDDIKLDSYALKLFND
jgi:hypothetical protein